MYKVGIIMDMGKMAIFLILALLLAGNFWWTARLKQREPFLLVLKRGEPVVATLVRALQEKGIASGSISGLGALENPEISYYELEEKRYVSRSFPGVFEVASLNGNISELEQNLALHMHVVLGDSQYRAIAGHLQDATVGGTLEITVIPFARRFVREKDPETGLNTIYEK